MGAADCWANSERNVDDTAVNGAKFRPKEWRIRTRFTPNPSTVAAWLTKPLKQIRDIVASTQRILRRKVLGKQYTISSYRIAAAQKTDCPE
jgi:hypothetical protein